MPNSHLLLSQEPAPISTAITSSIGFALRDPEESSNHTPISEITFGLKTVQVGSQYPLWKCKNATNLLHRCVHCLCNDCFSDEVPANNNKRRRVNRDDNILDKGRCNHSLLHLVMDVDATYFTDTYI